MQSLLNIKGIFSQKYNTLKFLWKYKRPWIVKKKKKKNLGKEQSWRNHIPWIRAIIQSYSNQHCLVLAQKQTQGSAEQSRETINKPHDCNQLVHDKAGRNIKWRKYSLFRKWCWENCTTTCGRKELEHFLSPYTKVNSKRFKI